MQHLPQQKQQTTFHMENIFQENEIVVVVSIEDFSSFENKKLSQK